MKIKTILFVCIGNSGRSQIAEAFFNTFSKQDKAISAGVKPDKKIHPQTVEIMREVGLDVSKKKPKLLTEKLIRKADRIIIMDSGLSDNIPKKYLTKVEKWRIEKLPGKSLKEIRKIRAQIKKKVKKLISFFYLK